MTAIDTLRVAQKLQAAGFTKKQAVGAAEVLADLLAEGAGKEATTTALSLLAAKLETMDRRQQVDVAGVRSDISRLQSDMSGVRSDISGLQSDMSGVRSDISGLQGNVSKLESMLSKLLEGQAVLLQNDMELRRRLDER